MEFSQQCPLCNAVLWYVFTSPTERRLQHGDNPEHSFAFPADVLVDPVAVMRWIEALHTRLDTERHMA